MIKKLLFILTFMFVLTGCDFSMNNMENIEIYTTNYPSEYITSRLYGDHSTIHSIYPNGVNVYEYKLTKKQIHDYSASDLFIFNGLSDKEKEYATKMRNNNKKLKIIDTTMAMEFTDSLEMLWLDPSNFLMMAQNIKKGFGEYINNYYLNNDIDKNYESLKVDASNLDAKIKKLIENADNDTIVCSSDMLNFLEKYGLTVYSLADENNSKNQEIVKDLIRTGKINVIFVKDNEEVEKYIKDLIKGSHVKTQTWYTLTNISEEKKNSNADYFTIMNENVDLLRNELYN